MLIVNFEDLGDGAKYADIVFNELYDEPILPYENILWGNEWYFLRDELKKDDIYKIDCDNERLQLRLKFYDIKYGNDYQLSQEKSENAKEIVIRYFDIPVAKFYLLKLNPP